MRKFIRVIPLVLIYGLIIFFSIKKPSGSSISIPYMDKIGHFIAYFVLGFTICLSLKSKLLRGLFVIISLTLGVSLELIQGKMPYRDMSFLDGVTNFFGLLTGVIIFIVFYRYICWLIKKLGLSKLFIED